MSATTGSSSSTSRWFLAALLDGLPSSHADVACHHSRHLRVRGRDVHRDGPADSTRNYRANERHARLCHRNLSWRSRVVGARTRVRPRAVAMAVGDTSVVASSRSGCARVARSPRGRRDRRQPVPAGDALRRVRDGGSAWVVRAGVHDLVVHRGRAVDAHAGSALGVAGRHLRPARRTDCGLRVVVSRRSLAALVRDVTHPSQSCGGR